MVEANIRRADARRHMQQARSLLVGAGVGPAASYLDHALASLDGAAEVGHGDDERRKSTAPTDPILVRAIGGAVAIIGTILARSDLVPLEELGRLFDLYANVSTHDHPEVGSILDTWGGMIAQAAAELERPQIG